MAWVSRQCRNGQRAYVLLETVLATGLLLVGLAVIGAQLQESNKSVRAMRMKARALMLAEQQLAQVDLGLVRFDSLDEVEEEDFGPRFRDWAWRMTIEPSAINEVFVLRLDILYGRRDVYEEDGFDYDNAEVVFTTYSMRPSPRPLNLITDFGLSLTQADQITEQFGEYNVDPSDVLPSDISNRPVEEMIPLLVGLLKATGLSAADIMSLLPPEARQAIEQFGGLENLLGQGESGGSEDGTGQQQPQPEEIPDE